MRTFPSPRHLVKSYWLLLAALTLQAHAACDPGLRFLSNYEFFGTRSDGPKLGAWLVFGAPGGWEIDGRLFTEPTYQDVQVRGLLAPPYGLTLWAQDDGRLLFQGTFVEDTDAPPDARCTGLAGATGDGVGAVMKIARFEGEPTSAHMNEVTLAVHNAILAGDAAVVAQQVDFPLHLEGPHRQWRVIHDEAQFIRAYASIVGPKLKARVEAEFPHEIDCNIDWCWTGSGIYYNNAKAKITGIASD